jgi:hypothetical protein
MNAERRKRIAAVKARIEADLATAIKAAATLAGELREEVADLQGEEQDYKDNMPESLANGERGEKAEAAINALDDAISALDDIETTLDGIDLGDALSNLDTAAE